MLEVGGVQLGTIFQGTTMVAMLSLLAIVGRAWIIGIPERLRVANESKVTAAHELADRYKAWRVEVHGLKNDLQVVAAKQRDCDRHLAEAHATNKHNENQMHTMLFLIRLLLKELERLAPDSLIVHQAKITLEGLGHGGPDPGKSTAVIAAEHTVEAAKIAVEEIKTAEEENGGS